MKSFKFAFAASFAAAALASVGAEAKYSDNVKVPMRDGVNLAADVYLPANRGDKIGCLLEFSPYSATKASTAEKHGTGRAEEWGCAHVWVDCRGLCNSEGVFETWEKRLNDDAWDLLEWISKQPWSNGRVVTVGGSYPGWTQLACLKSGHPALVACAPSVVTFYPYTINYQNGVLIPIFQEAWHSKLAGRASWEELTRHPDRTDLYWRQREDLGKLAKAKGRVCYQAGWFDMLGIETFRSFAKMPAGSVLRVGPWSHGVNTFDSPDIGYAKKNGSVTEDLEIEFLRSALENREMKTKPPRIEVYTMGRDAWQTLEAWPVPGTEERRLYLAPEGKLTAEAPTLWKNLAARSIGKISFDYYPDDPTPSKGCRIIHGGGQYDLSEIAARRDVLSFATEPLAEPLEVTGEVKASLACLSTAAESDFVVRLVDVYPDGKPYGILEGVYRGKFIGGVERQIEWFLDITSYEFQKGHRIGVQIAGAAAPHFQKSPNAARETVALGASCVILPVIPRK